MTALAASKGITVTQPALARLLAQSDDIVPVPGTRSPQHLAENVAAAQVALTPQDLDRIREILPHGAACSRQREAIMPDRWCPASWEGPRPVPSGRCGPAHPSRGFRGGA
ncbi:aldo/keto reductase [Streptomyces shenzhenensis]|uniref:aldo/keto reductase n=1 Tax=Streptomyces shenzhenensis TaxID=943815 RepID=UPI003D93AB99